MESIAARAFKSSCFPTDIAPTKPAYPQPLPVGEDYFLVSPAGDDFSIDEFFDLERLSEVQDKTSSSSSSSTSSLSSHDQFDEGSSFSATGLSGPLPAADSLAIPVDHMKELELWSNLMDDTLCDDVFPCPARIVYLKTGPSLEKRVRFEPETKPATVEAARFPAPKPVKPRSKRLRTGSSGAWPTCDLLKTGYSSPASSESGFELEKTGAGPTKGRKPGVKKPKRKPAVSEEGSLTGPVQQRKCTHCQVQKTPQWRTGPFGPKTLCNACGVRFKSGRLFPEYRPACSPEFTSEIHSNSHRKVVEMRKRKMSEPTGPDFAPTILSC